MTIAQVREALSAGAVTAVELVARHLERIGHYDRQGLGLNAVPILNPDMFEDAAESDRRYRVGDTEVRPLEGVPFTVKDSYAVRGLTVASGSPAFMDLIASNDAFTVARLRNAGAVLIGKTNMAPMAAGGMQRGVYGRAESPYNTEFMPAAYGSGSSNGSGVATAASLAVFGMAEETISSGRSPASNSGLCAYTPSRGLISIRGNWPLFPAWDVVVPHTRTMADLLAVIDVLMVTDPKTRGDFWRQQRVVSLPAPEDVRPDSFQAITNAWNGEQPLAGKRFGVPRIYIGQDPETDIQIRPSILERWEEARNKLMRLGATIIECDFPIVKRYEGCKPASQDLEAAGTIPENWMRYEFGDFLWWGWDDFLRANAEEAELEGLPRPSPARLAETDGARIFPLPPGALPDRYNTEVTGVGDPRAKTFGSRHENVPNRAAQGLTAPAKLPNFAEGLQALEKLREKEYEAWLRSENLDGLVFPANSDIAAADADRNPESADHAWRNGVLYSNGNYIIRHLGIPSVTVPMGLMHDTQMPIGLTFLGPAYQDTEILGWASAFESAGSLRVPPTLTPTLPSDMPLTRDVSKTSVAPRITVSADVFTLAPHGGRRVIARGEARGIGSGRLRVVVNGIPVKTKCEGDIWSAEAVIPAALADRSPWLPNPLLLVVTAQSESGGVAAAFCEA